MRHRSPSIIVVPAAIALLAISGCDATSTGTSVAAESSTTTTAVQDTIIGIHSGEVVDNECLLTAAEVGALTGVTVGEGTNVETSVPGIDRRCEYRRSDGTSDFAVASINIARLWQNIAFDDLIAMFRGPGAREIPGVARTMLVWDNGSTPNAGIYTDTLAVALDINLTDQSEPATAPTDEKWKVAAQQIVAELPTQR
ncbi:hypothetical protein [Nocardia otitidiscaviarum]|uniref:hypothetical protein n=1 Tax=Nocardia otitidiscaviarum TaxID=1823 RepID=UPI001894DF12|nr:hypothetical protein [Nocardia otitidiscaviarum]MBF6181756.1 hypothetical protein [Nocardia otitidiscaviarum]